MDAFDAIRWLYLVLAFIFVGWTFKNMVEDYIDMLDNPPYQKVIDTISGRNNDKVSTQGRRSSEEA